MALHLSQVCFTLLLFSFEKRCSSSIRRLGSSSSGSCLIDGHCSLSEPGINSNQLCIHAFCYWRSTLYKHGLVILSTTTELWSGAAKKWTVWSDSCEFHMCFRPTNAQLPPWVLVVWGEGEWVWPQCLSVSLNAPAVPGSVSCTPLWLTSAVRCQTPQWNPTHRCTDITHKNKEKTKNLLMIHFKGN